MKKVLFLSNHFITLYSFRKELIKKLIINGYDVYLSMPPSKENEYFEQMGCNIIETNIDRKGINPFKDIKLIINYIEILKDLKPDIIFSYTVKPNIYGSIASNITGQKQICNITGMGGTLFNSKFFIEIFKLLYKLSVKKSYKVFFQNNDDKLYFIKNRMVNNNFALLPGSGVNLEEFNLTKMPDDDTINFIFIGRVMKLKGIDEYIKCAESIKKNYMNVNFYIAGFIEEDEYKKKINKYNEQGIIKYIGFQRNINEFIQKCHCTILPSHGGEGTPNALLESAANGRICIASNINGSRDVIDDGVTGYLFNVGNSKELIGKVEKVIKMSYNEKKYMGLNARKKVENEYNRNIVIETYLKEI